MHDPVKRRFLLFAAAALLLCGCGKAAAQSAPPPPEAGTAAAGTPDTVVYVTKSGERYHREDCSSLRRSQIAISLLEAVQSDYGPCAICKPPLLPPELIPRTEGAAIYRVNREEPAGFEAVDFSRLIQAEVVDHVDGDTIRVRINNPPPGLRAVETIRLIGVDTPETVHPRREVETFGKEASDFTKTRLLGKTVYLAFDWDLRDRYDRLLAYVYTQDRRCHNADIIREGYGHAYTRFSFRFMEEFRTLEEEARRAKRGLWG
jgi:micrococcal nuclease